MRESVGYTVTLNIAIVFIIVVFTFLSSALIYYKSNKASKVIVNSIEKYEGYNELAMKEIRKNMAAIGYSARNVKCDVVIETQDDICTIQQNFNGTLDSISACDEDDFWCSFGYVIAYALQMGYNVNYFNMDLDEYVNEIRNTAADSFINSEDGYCTYVCLNKSLKYNDRNSKDLYYFYKVRTNMSINIPVINEIIDIPIYTNTNNIYIYNRNFEN